MNMFLVRYALVRAGVLFVVHVLLLKGWCRSFETIKLETAKKLCLKEAEGRLVYEVNCPDEFKEDFLWKILPGNRVLSHSGGCLYYGDATLRIKNCEASTNHINDGMLWYTKTGHLYSMSKECNQSPNEGLPSSEEKPYCNISIRGSKIQHVEMTKEANRFPRFISLSKESYSHAKLAQIVSKLRYYANDQAHLEEIIHKVEDQHDKLVAELKAAKTLDEVGYGAVVTVSQPDQAKNAQRKEWKFYTQQLKINEDVLKNHGIPIEGKISVDIKGLILPPESGEYVFVSKNLKAPLRFEIKGITVIDFVLAPLHGEVWSHPVFLHENQQAPFVLTSTVLIKGAPSFEILWSRTNLAPETILPFMLNPGIYDKDCTAEDNAYTAIACQTTFDEVANSESAIYLCPPGCEVELSTLEENAVNCHLTTTPICKVARAEGVLPARGGYVQAMVEKEVSNPSFSFLSSLNNSPVFRSCGRVGVSRSIIGFPPYMIDAKGIAIHKLLEVLRINPQAYSSWDIIISNSDIVLLTKYGRSKRYITDIVFSCGAEEIPAGYIDVGEGLLVRFNEKSHEAKVLEAYMTTSGQSVSVLPLSSGRSKRTCENRVLYLRYSSFVPEIQLPSIKLQCSDTFLSSGIKASSLPRVSARCPKDCGLESNNQKVFGFTTYQANSPVCLAALQMGIISDHGGVIVVHKMSFPGFPKDYMAVPLSNNGVKSFPPDAENDEFFFLTPLRGTFCQYPADALLSHKRIFSRNQKTEQNALWLMGVQDIKYDIKNELRTHNPDKLNENSAPKRKEIAHTNESEEQRQNRIGTKFNAKNKNNQVSEPQSGSKEIAETHKKELGMIESLNKMMEHHVMGLHESIEASFTRMQQLYSIVGQRREDQKKLDSKRKDLQEFFHSFELQIDTMLSQKKALIKQLESISMFSEPLKSITFSDNFSDVDINSRYYIIDDYNSVRGPSIWKVIVAEENGTHSSQKLCVVTESSIRGSNHYGTMLLRGAFQHDSGAFKVDLVKESNQGTVAIIFQYIDNKNWKSFEINSDKIASFRENSQGILSPSMNPKKLPNFSGKFVFTINFKGTVAEAYLMDEKISEAEFRSSLRGTVGLGVDDIRGQVMCCSLSLSPFENHEDSQRNGNQAPAAYNTAVPVTYTYASKKIEKYYTNFDFDKGHSKNSQKECAKQKNQDFSLPLNESWKFLPGSAFTLHGDNYERYIHGETIPSSPKICHVMISYASYCHHFDRGIKVSSAIRLVHPAMLGLVFQALDQKTFSLAVIDTIGSTTAKIRLLKVEEGTPYEISAIPHKKLMQDIWYTLGVVLDENSTIILLDDVPVLKATAKQSLSGRFGITLVSGSGDFKNFNFGHEKIPKGERSVENTGIHLQKV